jgi:hypothetical protein
VGAAVIVQAPVEAAGEHDVELVERGFPVVVAAPSAAADVGASQLAAAQVEQLDQGVVGGEVPAGLGDLAQLVVDASIMLEV